MQRQLHSQRLVRKGLTLVELLAVISIIGILASMVLVAVRGAQQDSLEAKTRSTIAKIHEILAIKYESYLTQAMPLKIPTVAFERTNGVRALSSREMSRVRLLAIRDLMRLEMPDRPGDVKYFGAGAGGKILTPDYLDYLDESFLPRLTLTNDAMGMTRTTELTPIALQCRLYETNRFNFSPMKPPAGFLEIRRALAAAQSAMPSGTFWETNNANQELLFLIVSQCQVDNGSAMELFSANEIGDTDGDGLKEFVDAFGTPIAWIRWPAGLDYGSGIFNTVEPFDLNGIMTLDPMDPLLSDIAFDEGFSSSVNYSPGRGLFPLVVSAGGDRKFGILFSSVSDQYLPPYTLPVQVMNGVFSPADNAILSGGPTLPTGYDYPYPLPDPYYPRTHMLKPGVRLYPIFNPIAPSIIRKDFSLDNVSNLDDFGAAL